MPQRTEADREKSRATVRALHLRELEAAGAARAAALKAADEYLDRIARLLPDALSAGLSLTEISRVAGISRPTLYELRGRYGEEASDLPLAVLQTIALRGPISLGDVEEGLLRPAEEVASVVQSFVDQGFVETDVDEDQREVFYWLLDKGEHLLDAWYEQEREQAGAG
jgi:chromosome segregation and condensation protein ScpB